MAVIERVNQKDQCLQGIHVVVDEELASHKTFHGRIPVPRGKHCDILVWAGLPSHVSQHGVVVFQARYRKCKYDEEYRQPG